MLYWWFTFVVMIIKMARVERSLDIIETKFQDILDYGVGYSDVVGQIAFPLLIALFAFAFPFLFSVINHINSKYDSKSISELFLDFDYASPNGKNIIMRISYFDALS